MSRRRFSGYKDIRSGKIGSLKDFSLLSQDIWDDFSRILEKTDMVRTLIGSLTVFDFRAIPSPIDPFLQVAIDLILFIKNLLEAGSQWESNNPGLLIDLERQDKAGHPLQVSWRAKNAPILWDQQLDEDFSIIIDYLVKLKRLKKAPSFHEMKTLLKEKPPWTIHGLPTTPNRNLSFKQKQGRPSRGSTRRYFYFNRKKSPRANKK